MNATKALRTALIASVLAGLAACSSDKLPPAPLVDFKPAATVTRVWAVALDALNASPSASGAQILVPQGQEVVAYQASSGAVAWRAALGSVQAPIGVSADQQTLLALVQGSEAVALNARTGEVLWRNSLPAEMRTQAASVGDVFVVLTADGRIVGLDEKTGRRRWALARNLPPLSVRGTGAVAAISASIAVVGLPGGKAVGVNVNTGKFVWEVNMAQSRGVNDVERIADVLPKWVEMPSLGLCATSYRQRAACVDEKGELTYAQEMSALSGLVASGQQWFALEEGSVKSWAVKTGMRSANTAPPEWSFDGLKGRTGNSLSPLAALGSSIVVHDSTGNLHVLSAQSGQTVARIATGLSADVQLQTMQVEGKSLLIAASDKTLSAWTTAK